MSLDNKKIEMFRTYVILLLMINALDLFAQNAISGQINSQGEAYESKVFLAKLDVDHIKNLKSAKEIAWSPIKEDGTFSFDKKHVADKDAVYRIYVNRMDQAINDTIQNEAIFILSSSDQLYFPKGDKLFSDYTTTNPADKEWKKLRAFEAELLQSQIAEEEGEILYKGYAKDSLRILMVKLIGVKALQEKQLLEQDIAKNPDFYLGLLAELKESEMPSGNYKFLEKRLAFLTLGEVQEKYVLSKIIIFVLGFLVFGLVSVLVFRRKKGSVIVHLSRQERNIQNLIVQGKTNKEIANELFISLSTVKTHITNIYGKLKVSSRQELLQKTQN